MDIELLIIYLRIRCPSEVAERTGVSITTIHNIRQRKTRMPHHRTLARLLPELGLTLEIKHASY